MRRIMIVLTVFFLAASASADNDNLSQAAGELFIRYAEMQADIEQFDRDFPGLAHIEARQAVLSINRAEIALRQYELDQSDTNRDRYIAADIKAQSAVSEFFATVKKRSGSD